MGYESMLIVGEACTDYSQGTPVLEVATVDLGKMGRGHFRRLLDASRAERTDTRRFFYFAANDAEPHVYKDLYDEALLPLDLDHAVKALDADGYQRNAPAVALLRSFRDHPEQWPTLVLLHYGH